MKIKDLFLKAIVTFIITFIVVTIVGYVYLLLKHSNEGIDWATSFRFGIIFAIILPWAHYLNRNKKGK